MLEELVELSAIAIVTDKTTWETYYNDGLKAWSRNKTQVDNDNIKAEIDHFWQHVWLFNPDGYYVKILATTVTYVDVLRPDLNLAQMIDDQVQKYSTNPHGIRPEQEVKRLHDMYVARHARGSQSAGH